MDPPGNLLFGFAAALGGGLLIGIERERRKGDTTPRGIAGVRTFALAALAGAGASALGQPLLMAAGAALIGVLAAVAYWRDRGPDPGVTTELALLVTYLMGAIAIDRPALAAGGAVVVTLLLAGRRRLHQFSVDTLSPIEARDGLVFASAALILLPLLPDAPLAWLGSANPRRIWGLVVVFMGLQAAGYVALRVAGARIGLAVSGLAAGFVSSTGTIAALGARVRVAPALLAPCAAGAMCSTVATVVLLGIVILAVFPPALAGMAASLALALVVAVASARPWTWRKREEEMPAATRGRAFNLLSAVGFAALLAAITAAVALVDRYMGGAYAVATAALGGVVDVHAAAASVLSLGSGGKIGATETRTAILMAFTTNTGSKLVAAFVGGGRSYGLRVGIGLLLTLAAAWLPALLPWPALSP